MRTLLSALSTALVGASCAQAQCIPLDIFPQNATASYTQTCGATFLPRFAIDGNTTSSWALGRCSGGGDLSLQEALVFETPSDVVSSSTAVKFSFKIFSGGFFPGQPSSNLTLGHFALSYTSANRSEFADGQAASSQLGTAWTRLTPTSVTCRWADEVGNVLPPNNQDPVATIRPDGSILISGPDPIYAIYTIEATVSNVTVTGFRLDMIDENGANPAAINGLPTGGPGRHGNGNCFIRELAFGYTRVPTITLQPQGGSICGGAALTLSVGVDGQGPFSYQWRRNGSNINGATGSTYSVPTGATGSYDVRITAPCGDLTSTAAVVTGVNSQIVTQPTGGDLCATSSVNLAVGVTGDGPFTYQWRKDTVNIPNATASSFQATAATGPGSYDVVITSACGTLTSNAAVVTGDVPRITTQPTGGNLCGGNALTLTVVAEGPNAIAYQWRKNGQDIAGATNTSYQVVAGSGAGSGPGTYDVRLTSTCGTLLSNPVTVTGVILQFTSQPQGGSLCGNESVNLSVTVDGQGPFTYQWRKNGQAIQGATASSYVVTQAQGAGTYDVNVTSSCGLLTSNPAVVTGRLCAADYNCDGFVDFFDYDDFVVGYQAGDMSADCNGDDFIDFFDYDCFVGDFEAGC